MSEKLSEKLTGVGCEQECIRMFELEFRVEALEAELEKANQLAIKLALQKGQQVDEIRNMRSRLAEAEKLPEKWNEKARGWEDKYDQVRNHTLENCARELVVSLRGEAEKG